MERLRDLGVRNLAIKPHPGYDVSVLVDVASSPEFGMNLELLASDVGAESYIDRFRWDLIVGVYSTVLFYAKAHYPADRVLTACRVVEASVPEPFRSSAARSSRQFLEEIAPRIPGGAPGLL